MGFRACCNPSEKGNPMSLTRFKAGTQYGDWKGTAAADEFGDATDDFDELFEATGKIDPENDMMIAFEMYAGEGHFYLAGLFHPKSTSNKLGYEPSLNDDFKNDPKPIRVRRVEVNLTLEQFFKYFKRFNVVLNRGSIDISGRDYEEISD
jgi:hypothetical protein